MYLVRTPYAIQNLFPNFTWRIPTQENEIYLTFDDGPIPEVTPWVIEQLAKYDARATFFCVGENAFKFPELMHQLHSEGHVTGNHTFNHLSGWNSDHVPYLHNVRKCAPLVQTNLFRPPYGRIRPRQAQFLMRHYRIVMWDVLSADFDTSISPEQCLKNVIGNAGPGSVVVLHDSLKAEKNLRYALPRILDHFTDQGFSFKGLSDIAEYNKSRISA